MAAGTSDWIGSVYLFIQSDKVSLPDLYMKQKTLIYDILWGAVSESTEGCRDSTEILKIHSCDHQLILCLKFCSQDVCQIFLKAYKEQIMHRHIQRKLEKSLFVEPCTISLKLKADAGELDAIIEKEEQCLKYISEMKPSFQKDDDIAEMEDHLKQLNLEDRLSSQNCSISSLPHSLHSYGNSSVEGSTFYFQGENYVDRALTSVHLQMFAKLVGKSWKLVGRSLGKNCRALNDTAIENLAYDFERDGRYEQAYQLLRLFKDSEGKRATLQRLVQALEEHGLNSIAQDLLSLNENGL